MPNAEDSEPISDASWDAEFFGLILDLGEKNESRYQQQVEALIRDKFLELEIQGQVVRYELDRVGCAFLTLTNKTFERRAWNRFGWRRTDKERGLPHFFAKTEAILLLKK